MSNSLKRRSWGDTIASLGLAQIEDSFLKVSSQAKSARQVIDSDVTQPSVPNIQQMHTRVSVRHRSFGMMLQMLSQKM